MKVHHILSETLDVKQVDGMWRVFDTVKNQVVGDVGFASPGEAEDARDRLRASNARRVATPPAATADADTPTKPGMLKRAATRLGKFSAHALKNSGLGALSFVLGGAILASDLDAYGTAYENNGCKVDGDDDVLRAQLQLTDNLTASIVSFLSAAAAGTLALKGVSALLSKMPGPQWLITTLVWGGASAVAYLLGKLVENTGLLRSWSDYIASEMLSNNVLSTFSWPQCSTSESNEIQEARNVRLQESKAKFEKEIKDFVLDDPKLLAMVKQASAKAKAAKATAS
tara:strand:+ start:67 stop:921 length:855 start_codon:yes stop_codon:yes gene_type:complete